MAIPVIQGTKSESEKFAGAEETYCIEALMQDGKALQAGTSHFLGQNFAKAFDVKFATKDGGLDHVWATSWGVSTRLMGALIMTHGDDNGLVLPPKLAPFQVVVVPIFRSDEDLSKIKSYLSDKIEVMKSNNISIKFDERNTHSPGYKFNEYELKGVPIRIAVGPRDIENKTIEILRRDTLTKNIVSIDKFVEEIDSLLADIQKNLLEKAVKFRKDNTFITDDYEEFKKMIRSGGFVLAHWDGSVDTEELIKKDTKATIRCIPEENFEEGKCIVSGKKSTKRVVFAKAY